MGMTSCAALVLLGSRFGRPTKDRGDPADHEAGGYAFEHLPAQMGIIVSTSSKGFAAEELVG